MDKYQSVTEKTSCDNEKKSSELGYKTNYLNYESKILNSDATGRTSDNKNIVQCNESNKTNKHDELDSYTGKKFDCLKNGDNKQRTVQYDNISSVPTIPLSVEEGARTSRYSMSKK